MEQLQTPAGDWGLLDRVDAKQRCEATRGGARRRLRDALLGTTPEPIPSYRGPIEDPQPDTIGVCCSGGGVRSAAFNLGALQVLQSAGILRRARYLAAVSGGSYIAAAFSMVAQTWGSGPRPPAGDGGHDDSNPELIERAPPFAPGSPEEQYLRNRSSYLAPRAMDKLFLVYRITLGIIFNIAFLALPLLGIGVLLGVFFYRPAFHQLLGHCGSHCNAELHPYLWLPPLAIGALSALLGLIELVTRADSGRRRRVLEIYPARLLVLAAIVAWFTIAIPLLVSAISSASGVNLRLSGLYASGSITALLIAVSAHLRNALQSPAQLLAEVQKTSSRFARLNARTRRVVAYAGGAIIGPALLLSVTVFAVAVTLTHASPDSVDPAQVIVGCAALALFALAYLLVDLTSWSLHPFYKHRLCTVFALKRVRPSDEAASDQEFADDRSGQDERAGIAVERDIDTLVPLSRTALRGGEWPTLLVCAAANVSDAGATPPGRQVTSFTFSPHAIGGPLVGGIATSEFEKTFGDRRRDVTLPAAVAMSGAALSPSMGKQTKRPLRFLMALANVRLGVWVPNPRWVARKQPLRRYRRARPYYLLCELLGRNRVNAKYLYVTDGGHYENLGLVELLRRGCTTVYCFDASGGTTFKELGDAVALARSEIGVQIDIDPDALVPSPAGVAAENVVAGTITYRDGTRGTLIYGRNVMTEAAPWDVRAYHEVDHSFPHNSTADQLYTDQKFEAYRELGASVAEGALALGAPARREQEQRPHGPAPEPDSPSRRFTREGAQRPAPERVGE
jgi:hypothetical protein